MKGFILMAGVALGLVCGATATAGMFGAEGAEGYFLSSMSRDLNWRPSCHKPEKPFSSDSAYMSSYYDEAQAYVDCVNRQAHSDAEYAVEQIKRGRDRAVEDL
jgi:hypothetical protein